MKFERIQVLRRGNWARQGLSAALFVALCSCAGSPSRDSTGEHVDDSVITAKIKAALAADPGVRAWVINVETVKGVVQLTGFVDSQLDAEQAVAVARSVPGVKSVKDDIMVRVGRDRRH